MPRRFLLLLLCAALALPAPLAWGQAADLQAAMSGAQYPLTLRPKDLDPSWRQVSLNGPTPSGIALPQGASPALLDSLTRGTIYFTKGQTVLVGSETFLVAYLVPVRYETVPYPNERTGWSGASADKSLSEEDVTYKLSLLNVRQITSLDSVLAFAPQTPEEARKQAEADDNARSLSNLKQIGLAMVQYEQDNDEDLPPMRSAASTQKALFPFVRDSAVFQQPRTHEPYLPNTSLSGRTLASFNSPSDMVTYYEAVPAPDGTRGVAFLDGHVKRIHESEWPALKAASHVPNVPPR